MNYWTYVEPGDDGITPVYHTFSEAEILKMYYPWWYQQMLTIHREHLISEQNCIEDWVVVNWAWPAERMSWLRRSMKWLRGSFGNSHTTSHSKQ